MTEPFMLSLLYCNLPALYELSVLDERTLLIRVQRDVWKLFSPLLIQSVGAIRGWRRICPTLPEFRSPTDHKSVWGFGYVLVEMERADEWVEWACALPDRKKLEGQSFFDAANAIVATLNVLFDLCSIYERKREYETGSRQLVTVEMLKVLHARAAHPISAVLAPTTMDYLATRVIDERETTLPELVEMMRGVYDFLMGRDEPVRERFLATTSPRSFYLQIPGDACSLSGNDRRNGDGGMELSGHNQDTAIQQFTFLMAIAKLCDLVRAWLTTLPPTP